MTGLILGTCSLNIRSAQVHENTVLFHGFIWACTNKTMVLGEIMKLQYFHSPDTHMNYIAPLSDPLRKNTITMNNGQTGREVTQLPVDAQFVWVLELGTARDI